MFEYMKRLSILLLLLGLGTSVFAQKNAQNLYDAEKSFDRIAAEKGLNQAHLEFSATDAICFYPQPTNCRDFWRLRPPSVAFMQRHPNFIDVSSNGALGYAIGTSVFRPKGKDDPNAGYGEYVRIWQRQPDGKYLTVLDIDVAYLKIPEIKTNWQSPPDSDRESNAQKSSAADASTAFFETAANQGLHQAYKTFLAEDARILRAGDAPTRDKKAALAEFKKEKSSIAFAKRTVFVGAADLAYVSNSYTKNDKSGRAVEKGNFLQIWKMRGGGRWQIVLDLFLPGNER